MQSTNVSWAKIPNNRKLKRSRSEFDDHLSDDDEEEEEKQVYKSVVGEIYFIFTVR